MNTRIPLTLGLIFLFSLITFGQQKKETPLTAVDGTRVNIDEGWKVLEMFFINGDGDKVTTLYTYQTDSVIKIAPHKFKFWIKIKNYKHPTLKHSLTAYEVKCNMREIRIVKMVRYPNSGKPESAEDPDAAFENVEPESLDEMVFSAICKAYDKPT